MKIKPPSRYSFAFIIGTIIIVGVLGIAIINQIYD